MLMPEGIDSSRMLVLIRTGKDGKDRVSILPDLARTVLRKYCREHKPQKWLFPRAKPGSHITEHTVQKGFIREKEKTGIHKDASVHSLRCSLATHLLEVRTALRYILELLRRLRKQVKQNSH